MAAPPQQTVTPHLRVRNAGAALEFYQKAFGATEVMRFVVDEKVAYARVAIGNTVILLGEEALDHGLPSPLHLGGTAVNMCLDVADADAVAAQAVAAGATLVVPVADQFYGERSGRVVDPFGHVWVISTRKEDLSLEEMYRRFAILTKKS